MSKATVFCVMLSFAISIFVGPVLIPLLRRLRVGQTVREEGPREHLKKTGTPTMGGMLILCSVLFTTAGFWKSCPGMIPVLLLTTGFGLIGLLDDYIKVVLHRSMGLAPGQKFTGQLLVTGVFAWYLMKFTDVSLAMRIPWTENYLDLGIWNLPFLFLVVLGTANGVNFTDGLDGLAGSVTVMVAVFFTVAAAGTRSGIEPVTSAVCGALLGFLLFNVHPAAVFMGDTGSLALGGFVAGSAYMLQMPLYIVIVGIVYLAEVLSVILQVGYFKLSGGKRLFKMAPLHHHFELCGWSETRITAVFTVVTALMCLLALLGLP